MRCNFFFFLFLYRSFLVRIQVIPTPFITEPTSEAIMQASFIVTLISMTVLVFTDTLQAHPSKDMTSSSASSASLSPSSGEAREMALKKRTPQPPFPPQRSVNAKPVPISKQPTAQKSGAKKGKKGWAGIGQSVKRKQVRIRKMCIAFF